MAKFSNDVERIHKVLTQSRVVVKETVSEFISLLQGFIECYSNEIEVGSSQDQNYRDRVSKLFEDLQTVRPLKRITEEHRSIYPYISRLHKNIERTFPQNPESLQSGKYAVLNSGSISKVIPNQAVDQYLVREGLFNEAEEFEDFSGVEGYSSEILQTYEQILTVIEDVKAGNIDDSIAWVENDRSLPPEVHSDMRMKLYCLKTLRLIKNGDPMRATEFLRSHIELPSFQMSEIVQQLSTLCIFPNAYPELLAPEYEQEVILGILKDAYTVLNQPASNPLEAVVAKADELLPNFIALSKVCPERVWTTPAPLDTAAKNSRFHSILVCPISYEVANNDNPAMLQPCGHWATRNALSKLIKSSRDGRVKCHICPQTFNEADLKLLVV